MERPPLCCSFSRPAFFSPPMMGFHLYFFSVWLVRHLRPFRFFRYGFFFLTGNALVFPLCFTSALPICPLSIVSQFRFSALTCRVAIRHTLPPPALLLGSSPSTFPPTRLTTSPFPAQMIGNFFYRLLTSSFLFLLVPRRA